MQEAITLHFTGTAQQVAPGQFRHSDPATRRISSQQRGRYTDFLIGLDPALCSPAGDVFYSAPDITSGSMHMLTPQLDKFQSDMCFFFLGRNREGLWNRSSFDGLPFVTLVFMNKQIGVLSPDSLKLLHSDFINVANAGDEDEFFKYLDEHGFPSTAHTYRVIRDKVAEAAVRNGMLVLSYQ